MLTDKQRTALAACADPDGVGWLFWEEARRRWQGKRQTLGSLHARGLVGYSHEAGWSITDAGREELRLKG